MALTLEDLRRCSEVLQALVEDRGQLAVAPEELRVELLTAAGLLASPSRDDRKRLAASTRRHEEFQKREADRKVRAETRIREARQNAVFVPPPLALPPSEPRPERVLQKPRHCYICKAEFRQMHFFYDAMCIPCGDFNHAKRFQKADLRGQVALITGARVKIGFQASLMLLRSGATVIATTRFPNDATGRYAREPDFTDWAHRLQIHGLDLRHAPSVELFARHIEATHPRLDILINNAAQTVRRPPGFYRHLLASELRAIDDLPGVAQPLLSERKAFLEELHPSREEALAPTWRSHDPSLGIHASAALSLVPYALEQAGNADSLFPQGHFDADLQQVDLRRMNSWRLSLSEVETSEMLEVHLVNAVAPFILCSKLKPLMLKQRDVPGHVVNVSAMEGSFSRGPKTDKHPHTNMAKAALNMLTLTSAPDLAKSRIWMNAADTGWVTDEDPIQHAERKITELDFQPPLDIVDGAARVIDPVFDAVNRGTNVWGLFFKDYKPTAW